MSPPARRGSEHFRFGIRQSLLQISRKDQRGKPLRSAPCKRYFRNAHSDSDSDSESLVFGGKSKGGAFENANCRHFSNKEISWKSGNFKNRPKKMFPCSHVPRDFSENKPGRPMGWSAAADEPAGRPMSPPALGFGCWVPTSYAEPPKGASDEPRNDRF